LFCVHGVAETKSRKKERQSKRGCLVLFSTIFNISDLLVDTYVNSYQKRSEGSGFLKDKNQESTKEHNICLMLPK
jgi:hypothetical protein